MIASLRLLWREPLLRMLCGTIVLQGVMGASIFPFQSLMAIRRFGFSDQAFALILTALLVSSVSLSILIGIRTDQHPERRRMALAASAAMAAGAGLVLLLRTPWAFVAAHVLLLPLAGTMMGQVFATARLALAPHPQRLREGPWRRSARSSPCPSSRCCRSGVRRSLPGCR
ncbi:hypothetical protein [Pseudoroseicyclus aestuarii]|uniref:MFS transporter n=1 Tax=Pseudoroseicyclus aestuarii TaxID=1795041 RepID=A0A318SXK6_9RHOB|nr:hypothetical protein [Pseudoroseicyclus aestuarii]PYE85099.1 hypothetical protein DFP88_102905 [Pseudoroseicyclus aestuarii]